MNWLSSRETKDRLIETGIPEGELVAVVAWLCLARSLIASGYNYALAGESEELAKPAEQKRCERVIVGRQFWNVLRRWSRDPQFSISIDWERGNFRFTMQVEGAEPPFAIIGYNSVMFDGPALDAECRSLKNDPTISDQVALDEMKQWIIESGRSYDSKTAWPAFQKHMGTTRAGMRKQFDPIYKEHYPRPRGRPPRS